MNNETPTTSVAVQTQSVTFAQMERMAITVAKSGLFGMKTPEQALALMALAQSEGIHPMTAVRDYHIIQGRPSLKADTMLARFQADGGTVEWVTLTDQKCEAIFRHPQNPKPVAIEWTIERAKTAGLTGKDVWKGYARAMLRSRVISEGVRTVRPGLIAGIYSPEEMQSLEHEAVPQTVEAIIASVDSMPMPREEADEWMSVITSAKTLEALKQVFAQAHTAAKKVKDAQRIGSFTLAYEARKEELARPADAVLESSEVREGDVI